MLNLKEYALNLLMNSPRCKNNQMAQNFIRVLQTGNDAEGEEMANNILQSMGMTKEDALKKIRGEH